MSVLTILVGTRAVRPLCTPSLHDSAEALQCHGPQTRPVRTEPSMLSVKTQGGARLDLGSNCVASRCMTSLDSSADMQVASADT